VDPFGRVFAADGQRHQGLSVADGSVIPSALGVTVPDDFGDKRTFRGAQDRLSRRPVSGAAGAVSMAGINALDAIAYNRGSSNPLPRCPTLPIDQLVNAGGGRRSTSRAGPFATTVTGRGFFPSGHVLNAFFERDLHRLHQEVRWRERTFQRPHQRYDGRIHARNSLEWWS